MYFGSTDAEHVAAFHKAVVTWDIVLARLKARPLICTTDALSDIITLRGLADVMIAHGAAGAEAADKEYTQAHIVDAETTANAYIRRFGEECVGKPAPPNVTTPTEAVAAINALSTGGKLILGGLAGAIFGGGLVALFKR